MYYTVIKHDGHLRTRGKCRKHEPQASIFYISRVFSNVRSVLSQCNTRIRLLHLLYDIDLTIKHALSMFYTLIKHGVLTNQSARAGSYLCYKSLYDSSGMRFVIFHTKACLPSRMSKYHLQQNAFRLYNT